MTALKTYLVEDSPVIRESLIATLEELVPVLVVGTAEDEDSATRWLSQPANQADLVIVDIFLKSGSGLGVLRAAQAWRSHRHWVVLSNYATPDMQRQCLELGASRVFDKSNDIDALMDYCNRLADSGAAEEPGRANDHAGALPNGAATGGPSAGQASGFKVSHAWSHNGNHGHTAHAGQNGHDGRGMHKAYEAYDVPHHGQRRDAGPSPLH